MRGVGSADFHLAARYAWEVNNLAPHGVFNGRERDRVHFIFEVFEEAGLATDAAGAVCRRAEGGNGSGSVPATA